MPAQDVAGEVERATDQHVVRPAGGSRGRANGLLDRGGTAGLDAKLAEGGGRRRGIAAQRLARHGHETKASWPAAATVSGTAPDPWWSACPPPDAARDRLPLGQAGARTRPAAGLWPPSSQTLAPGATSAVSGPGAAAAAGPARRRLPSPGRWQRRPGPSHPAAGPRWPRAPRSPAGACPAGSGAAARGWSWRSPTADHPPSAPPASHDRAAARALRPQGRGPRSPPAPRGCGPITAGTPGFRMPAFSNAMLASVSPR